MSASQPNAIKSRPSTADAYDVVVVGAGFAGMIGRRSSETEIDLLRLLAPRHKQ